MPLACNWAGGAGTTEPASRANGQPSGWGGTVEGALHSWSIMLNGYD